MIDVNRPDDQKTRVELVLSRVFRQWNSDTQGYAFKEAILDFLTSHQIENANTARAYSYAVVEFLTWLEETKGRVPLPSQVTKSDVSLFVAYLMDRQVGPEKMWLENDPRRIPFACYEATLKTPGIGIVDIRKYIATRYPAEVTSKFRRNPDGSGGQTVKLLRVDADAEDGRGRSLEELLGDMVRAHVLRREPTLDELRRGAAPGVEASPVMVRPPATVFKYFVAKKDTRSDERASSTVSRLSCLLSLWNHMIRGGENTASSSGLLRYNIWRDALKRISKQASGQSERSRIAKTPDAELVLRLLATTFERQYSDSIGVARAVFVAKFPGDTYNDASFTDLRDRLIILILSQLGLRRSEVGSLRRRNFRADGTLEVLGKGGKKRVIMTTPAIWRRATGIDGIEKTTGALPDLVRRINSTEWGKKISLAESPEVAIVPVVKLWGKNAVLSRAPLSGAGVAAMLRRRAAQAGLASDEVDLRRVHAHGFRHLFAQSAVDAGTKLNALQQILGHSNLATTSRYVEERRTHRLISQQFADAEAPEQRPAPEVARAAGPVPPARALPPPGKQAAEEAFGRLSRKKAEPPIGDELRPSDEGAPARRKRRAVEQTPAAAVGEQAPPAQFEVFQPPRPEGTRPRRRIVGAATEEAAQKQVGSAEPEKSEATSTDPAELRKQRRAAKIAARKVVDKPPVGFGGVYDENWGEVGDRSYLDIALLPHVYEGKHTRLIWWDGASGALKPEMPVMSRAQASSSCERASVCEQLSALWDKWGSSDEFGVTAQEALIRWVYIAQEQAKKLDHYVVGKDLEWAPYAAPAEVFTAGVLREHRPDAIVGWFGQVAWQWSTGELGDKKQDKKKGATAEELEEIRIRERSSRTPSQLPAWVQDRERDPILSLPLEERHRLLDWLLALQGKEPVYLDYGGGKVKSAIALMQAMSVYDIAQEGISEYRLGAKARSDERVLQWQKKAEAELVSAAAEVRRLSGGKVDVAKLSAKRKAMHKAQARGAGAGKQGGESNRAAQYVAAVSQVFGKDVDREPIIYAYAAGPAVRKVVLDSGILPLTVDASRQTIVHDKETIARLATAYRIAVHSECVARRIARFMWDIRASRGVVKMKASELADILSNTREFFAPCSRDQERELRDIVGARAFEQASDWRDFWEKVDERRYVAAGGKRRDEGVVEKFQALQSELDSLLEKADRLEEERAPQGKRDAVEVEIEKVKQEMYSMAEASRMEGLSGDTPEGAVGQMDLTIKGKQSRGFIPNYFRRNGQQLLPNPIQILFACLS